MTSKFFQKLGASQRIRQNNGIPYQTDNRNYIFDYIFPEITYPADLERELNLIPGVVDNGLFIGMATIVITLDKNKEININMPK